MATELTDEQTEELRSKGSVQLPDGSLLVRAVGPPPGTPMLITVRLRYADRYRLVYALVHEGQLVDEPKQILCDDPGQLDRMAAFAAQRLQVEFELRDFERVDLDLVADVGHASQQAALHGLGQVLEFIRDPANTPDG